VVQKVQFVHKSVYGGRLFDVTAFENELGSVLFSVSPDCSVFVDNFQIDGFPDFEDKFAFQDLRVCALGGDAFGINFLHDLYATHDIGLRRTTLFTLSVFVDMANAFLKLLLQRNFFYDLILQSDSHLLISGNVPLKQDSQLI